MRSAKKSIPRHLSVIVLLLLTIGLSQAEVPPSVYYAASNPCSNEAYPLVDAGTLIVCDKTRRPTLAFDPKTGRIKSLGKPHRTHTNEPLQPPPRIGGRSTTTPQVLVWETDGPGDDSDVWLQRTAVQERRGLDVGPGDQHHPVGSGDWIAWVDRGNIKLWNTQTGQKETIQAKTGFHAPPALHENTACWEFRHTHDIDLRCSNGYHLDRPGHQTHPLLLDNLLIFREKGLLMGIEIRPSTP